MGILDQLVSISEEFVWQAPFNPQLHFRREYDCDRLLPDIGRRLVGVSFCAAPRRRQEHVSRRGAAPGWLVFVIMARPSNYPPSRHLLLERSHSQLTLSVPMQHMAGLAVRVGAGNGCGRAVGGCSLARISRSVRMRGDIRNGSLAMIRFNSAI